MSVVSFDDYKPSPRHDSLAWTKVRIAESETQAGPFDLIDTIDVTPAPNPAEPPFYSFTTEEGTLAEGWYVVTFEDADADLDAPTEPVYRAATPSDDRKPTVAQVALLLRTRTVKGLDQGLGGDTGPADFTTFDDTTRPTSTEVQSLINTAFESMQGRLPYPLTEMPDHLNGAYSEVTKLYTAILVELSFFRESANEQLLELWRDMITDILTAINTAWERELEEPGSAGGTAYGIGSLKINTIREQVVAPEAEWMEGIDWP